MFSLFQVNAWEESGADEDDQQIPRTSYISRASAARVPGASFRRWNSTGEEKVKGQVIGIDLGTHFANSFDSLINQYTNID